MYRPPSVSSRMLMGGIKKKVTMKHEMKHIDYVFAGDDLASTPTWTKIWGTDGVDSTTTPFFPDIPQGAQSNQRIGLQVVLRYVDLRFNFNQNSTVVNGNVGETIRIVLVRHKIPNISSLDLTPTGGTSVEPIDTRKWRVLFDKCVILTLGYLPNALPNPQAMVDRSRQIKMIIPIRQLATYLDETNVWRPSETDRLGLYIVAHTVNMHYGPVFARIFYKDP